MEKLADITERFRFVEDSLIYVDAPVEGFVVHVANGTRYAFRSREIVANTLWHWVLLPVAQGQVTVEDVFAAARANPPSRWVSVVEDRRDGPAKLELAEMDGAKTRPPIE